MSHYNFLWHYMYIPVGLYPVSCDVFYTKRDFKWTFKSHLIKAAPFQRNVLPPSQSPILPNGELLLGIRSLDPFSQCTIWSIWRGAKFQRGKFSIGVRHGKGYSIWKVRGGDVRVPKKNLGVGGLENFPISRVGGLIFWAIPVGGGVLGNPPRFYGVVKYHSTPTFLGVLPIIHI